MVKTDSTKTNPVKRFSNLVQPYTKDKAFFDNSVKTEGVLKVMFDTPDNTEMFVKLGKLHELVEEVDELAKSLPIYSSVQANLSTFKNLLNPLTEWAKIRGQLNAQFWGVIDTVSMLLDTQDTSIAVHEKELTKEELTELKKTVLDFQEKVINSEIELGLQEYLNRHIRAILAAIDDYRISGVVPVVEALEGFCGHVALTSRTNEGYMDKMKDAGFLEVVRTFNDLASFASVSVPAIGNMITLIGQSAF